MRFVVDSTQTSGSRRSRRAAIILLLLGLIATVATYAKNVLPRLWLNTRITTALACSAVKARVKGPESAKESRKNPLLHPNSLKKTRPRLRAGIRPSFAPTTPETNQIGLFWHYEGNQWT